MTTLTVTTVEGGHVRSHEVKNVGRDAVVTAIAAMCGTGEIYLGDPSTVFLGIAGGPDRFFVGYGTSAPDGHISQVRASDPGGDPIEVWVGGQPTTLASDYLVPIEVATDAALYFLENGEENPFLTWDVM